MLDSYVDFGVVDILVPGASSWNPAAVAWGVVSMWMLVAVQISSLFMKRLPRHLWRGIHLLSYLMLWAGIIHGVQAGTDAGNPFYVWSMAYLSLVVVFLTAYRILAVRRPRRRPGEIERVPAFSGRSGTTT
jgi:DMSO/TMAO reductase YedYZ heme-binding membrane subunit